MSIVSLLRHGLCNQLSYPATWYLNEGAETDAPLSFLPPVGWVLARFSAPPMAGCS